MQLYPYIFELYHEGHYLTSVTIMGHDEEDAEMRMAEMLQYIITYKMKDNVPEYEREVI